MSAKRTKADLLRELVAERARHAEATALIEEHFVPIIAYLAGGEGMPEKWRDGRWFTEPLARLNAWRGSLPPVTPKRGETPDWLSLLLGIWPVSCEDVSSIPTCRYCGSQRGTPDGQEFVHAETCAWDRVKKSLDAERLTPQRHDAAVPCSHCKESHVVRPDEPPFGDDSFECPCGCHPKRQDKEGP